MRARAGVIGFPGAEADTPAGQLSGGERARLLLGLATLVRPASRRARRADQSSGHRQPRGPRHRINSYPGAVILGLARPLSHRGLRRPAVVVADGQGRAIRGRSRRIPRTPCWPSAAVLPLRGTQQAGQPQGRRRAQRTGRDQRRRRRRKRTELAPLRRRIAEAESRRSNAMGGGDRAHRRGAGRSPAFSPAIRRGRPRSPRRAPTRRARSDARRMIGSKPAPPIECDEGIFRKGGHGFVRKCDY